MANDAVKNKIKKKIDVNDPADTFIKRITNLNDLIVSI